VTLNVTSYRRISEKKITGIDGATPPGGMIYMYRQICIRCLRSHSSLHTTSVHTLCLT